MENEFRPLSMGKSAKTMAVKCYIEQLPDGEVGLIDAIHSLSPDEYFVVAIKHDKGGKDHWHVLIKGANRDKGINVSSMLKKLKIQFRDGIDDALLKNHGVETTGNFVNYAVYLLHKTVEAKRAGKVPYDVSEFITNLPPDELQRLLDGYSITKKKLKPIEYPIILENARKAGYELRDVDDFIKSLNILGLHPTKENGIRNAYLNGAKQRMRENKKMYRLFIEIAYIFDEDYERIFYAADKALEDIQNRLIATDGVPLMLNPSIEAIVTLPVGYDSGLYNDFICEVGKPTVVEKTIWAGNTIVIVNKVEDFNASRVLKTNFFNCTLRKNRLRCDYPPDTMLPSEEVMRLSKEYKKFRDRFNDAMAEFEYLRLKHLTGFENVND